MSALPQYSPGSMEQTNSMPRSAITSIKLILLHDWKRMSRTLQAPAGATVLRVELILPVG